MLLFMISRMPAAAALRREAQLRADALDRRPGGLGHQLHVAAELEGGVQPTQHHVGVGGRRLGAAAAVAGWARVGARALGADLEQAGRVEPGDAAAAGPDGADVEHGRGDGDAELELGGRGLRRPPAGHQAGVEAGAADVGGHQRVELQVLTQLQAADHAAGRAALNHGDGLGFGGLRRHDAAVAAHDQQPPRAASVQLVFERGEVFVDARLEVGVDHRRARALELAPLREHVRADRDVGLGVELLHDLARAALMFGIEEREQIADGDGLDFLGAQSLHRGHHVFFLQRLHDLAVRADALANFQAERAIHQVPRLAPVQVE